ncbi:MULTISPECIES: hypothetical protein [unclassified Bacillus (in: firmicutes)]|uniref:hypothetical protein n=1 Tax=unclassified Bacillus (in: firmicutes) TaxID=185979 RepID=UPI0008F39A42|nr:MULTISPECIES: hypothetical protein [unclassified Bacillus (in: firmicutes)]SFA71144.1 hypothetical protein SAMN02799634_101185 [Bacillus sp. UNCCL13]SFQ61258.1 hypothetical protein SAMN04488577_0466 [Bacillus sp. cl95]
MDIFFIFIGINFFILLGFYAIHIFLTKIKWIKYLFAGVQLLIGITSWLSVLLTLNSLTIAIVGSFFLINSLISFVIAFLLDLFEKAKPHWFISTHSDV